MVYKPSVVVLSHSTEPTHVPTVSGKGYDGGGLLLEVQHCVIGDQGIHKADHVMLAQLLLLGRNFVGDDVQALIYLRQGETNR